LIELIFRQPYTKGQFLVDAGIAERKTAADYLYETLLLSLPCAFPLLHQERVPLREKVPDTFSEGTA
jgi:hypothetical protein